MARILLRGWSMGLSRMPPSASKAGSGWVHDIPAWRLIGLDTLNLTVNKVQPEVIA